MRVRDIMNTDVVTAEPGTAIGQVAKRMADADVGAVVIVEGGKPIGIVTDRDLVVEHLAKGHTQDHTVQEAMSGGGPLARLVTIAPDLDVLEAAQELGRHKVGRLPVVEGDRLVGLVSAGDLAKQLRKALDGLLAEGEKAEQ
jgi:CBS domain-containing protein